MKPGKDLSIARGLDTPRSLFVAATDECEMERCALGIARATPENDKLDGCKELGLR